MALVKRVHVSESVINNPSPRARPTLRRHPETADAAVLPPRANAPGVQPGRGAEQGHGGDGATHASRASPQKPPSKPENLPKR